MSLQIKIPVSPEVALALDIIFAFILGIANLVIALFGDNIVRIEIILLVVAAGVNFYYLYKMVKDKLILWNWDSPSAVIWNITCFFTIIMLLKWLV